MPLLLELPNAVRHLAEVNWTPAIGDPGWLGWITAAGYLLCGLLCFWTARRTDSCRPWLALAAVYAGLGINKQLDLQTLLTAVGREIFRELDLYDQRRNFQIAFMLVVLLLALVAGFWLCLRLSAAGLGARLAASGAAMTISFVLIRAASFHHVDVLFRVPLGSVPAKGLFENLGTFITLAGAGIALATTRTRPRRPDSRTNRLMLP